MIRTPLGVSGLVLDLLWCRYLFHSESGCYLKGSESHFAIANTCLKYLRSDCFNPNNSDQAILEGITRGSYILQDYVVAHWLQHAMEAVRHRKSDESVEDLSASISETIGMRANNSRSEPATISGPTPLGLEVLGKQKPGLFENLKSIHSFQQKKRRDFSLFNGKFSLKPFTWQALMQGA